jgi:hypothetical protein
LAYNFDNNQRSVPNDPIKLHIFIFKNFGAALLGESLMDLFSMRAVVQTTEDILGKATVKSLEGTWKMARIGRTDVVATLHLRKVVLGPSQVRAGSS